MKHICLIFKLHLPLVLNCHRFFEIGDHRPYLDVQTAENQLAHLAKTAILPANNLLLRQINSFKGKIKVSFYLSGTTAELLEKFAGETFESFRQLASTGSVEFLSGTYSWSLSALYDQQAFRRQIGEHGDIMQRLTGKKPSRIFFNTDLLYNNETGQILDDVGFNGVITEGDRQLLGWKSPNLLYTNSFLPSQKLFFRNPDFSDQLVCPFQLKSPPEHSPDPKKYLAGLLSVTNEENLINLVVPYELFGHQGRHRGDLLHFTDHFLYLAANTPGIELSLPSGIVDTTAVKRALQVNRTISTEEETGFGPEGSGNELQREALSKLYELSGKTGPGTHPAVLQEWNYLQASDHFRHMATHFSPGAPGMETGVYGSPFEAFINFMNILNDFKIKLDQSC